MDNLEKNAELNRIVLSCYYSRNRDGEHFVPEHTLSYQIAGSLTLTDGKNEYNSSLGSFRLVKRNQLLKFVKQPPEAGEYKSLSLYLDQEILKNFSIEYGISAEKRIFDSSVINLKKSAILTTYLESLKLYNSLNGLKNKQLVDIKLKEGILLLLQTNPELKNILFDFTEPHKINLEEFMYKNYHFNVKMERFAYLTGRSLATFKRDFEQIFNTSPGRWLQQKRLQEAYYLITKKGKRASDIYLELGFEDLSHFSFVFKKTYGVAPSRIIT